MVKKRLIFLLVCLLAAASLGAQEVRENGLVGYNNTFKWYGGADVKGVLHVDNTDFTLNLEALTAKTYSLGMTVSQSFEVCSNGFLFLDGTLHSRIFSIYKTYEFVYAGSVGFRMRHFSAQVGLFSRTIDAFGRDWHSLEKMKISVMGFDNPWDVYLIGSNYNDFEYERMWEPIFSLGGRYDFKERWSAVAEGTLEAAGIFHGTVKFYEAVMRIGIKYKIK